MAEVLTLCSGVMYNGPKDLVLFILGERQDVKDLEDRISKLILNLESLFSEKNKIDQSLRDSVSKEKSDLYPVMTAELGVIHEKTMKLINKYMRLTKNQLSPTNPSLSIEMLNDLKSKIATFKFFKFARLSRDVDKLNKRALEAKENLKQDHMIQKKEKPNLHKLDEDANVLPVFDKYVDEIMKSLFEDEPYNRVGIHGLKGVGKTTVLRKLYNRLLELCSSEKENLKLDYIIWIDYPQVSETEKTKINNLQNEIMEQLQIRHEASTSIFKNENTISTFLRDKKYVLLMDHVSKLINLERLGVKQDQEYKVVVCSSEKKLVKNMTEHLVEIQALNEDNAMALIKNICGELKVSRREIAKRIIECCGGIPWLIHFVFSDLKDKQNDDSWENMLQSLKSDTKSFKLIELGPYAQVYEMKYEGLAAHAKKCLLYCALFPPQHSIRTDYLVECWTAEEFIVEKEDQKVRNSRVMGQGVLDRLTEDYLLQWYSGKKYVVMEPIFRRFALEQDYPDEERCKNWVQSCASEPNEADWATVTRMSLIGCRMELPQSPNSPNICTLLLQSLKQEAKHLPESFFAHMDSLRVLDLYQAGITALPGSIDKLVKLKSLYLNGCPIVALPPEAVCLKKLKFLDISETSISTLPKEIKHMVDMRCLRASLSAKRGNHKGEQVEEFEAIIPEGIIRSLKNLEELSIFTDFDFQGGNGIAVAERLAMELASLEHLNTLCFNFPNVSSLQTFVTHSKALKNQNTFRSFEIFVGRHETRRHSQEPEFSGMLAEKWLRYSTNEEFSQPCRELLKQASALEIIGHDGLTSFTGSQFDLDLVEVCVVERCNHLENIVDGYKTSRNQESLLLPNLEKLYLYDLEMLKCIWSGPVTPKSLVNLTAITVDGCPELTMILDPALAHSLGKLEYLKVENCCRISKIIEGSGEISEDVELLKSLKRIEVSNLPELECICENPSINCKSLKSIVVKRCSKLRSLSLAHTNERKLPSIHCECEESWWNTLTSGDKQKLREHFIKEESIEAGAQSRQDEASTSASGRHEKMPIGKTNDPPEETSRHRDDQSVDDQRCQYGGTSGGASSTEVELQKENVAATRVENQGSEPISTSESMLVPDAVVPDTFPFNSSSFSLSIEIKDIFTKTSEAKMPSKSKSRRGKASTSASGRPKPRKFIPPKPNSSSEKPSRRLEEKYEAEESPLEGKKMEHEVRQEVQAVDEMKAWTYTEKHSVEQQEVKLQKENVAAIPVENQGSDPTSTSEITLVPDAVVPKTPSNMAISESGFISEQQRKIQEADEPRTSTNATKLPSIHSEESCWNTLTSDDQLECKDSFIEKESIEAGAQSRQGEVSTGFFKEESVEAGAQSRRGEALTGASGRPKARKFIPQKPKSSSEKPSRRLEEIYEVEEPRLEGKKMEHEHPGTDQPFSTLSGDDVQQDQYVAGASLTEVQVVDETKAWTNTEKHSVEQQEVELQKENVAAIPVENQGSVPTSTSEITLVPDAVVPKTPSNMAISVSSFISEHHREIQEADEPRTLTDAKYSGEQPQTEPTSSSNGKGVK